ncbi:MAG: phosphotransferase [Ilumatobacter sp.]|nr:phosphotransferase [Ilumatobacter sp.]
MTESGGLRPAAPGRLLASGRAADVYDIGDGRVVRRYRERRHRPRHEERVMRHVAAHDVAVPAVHDLGPGHDPETDIVMDRVDGPTMLEDLERRPWMLVAHARLLARLLRAVAAVPAPVWMQPAGRPDDAADSARRPVGVVHLDLHPMNVIVSPHGPVVIDWTNATGAPAGFDAAMSYVLMATYEVDGPRDRFGQQLMVSLFRRAVGRAEVDAFLVAACDHRLADVGVTPGERVNVAALRSRARPRR